MAPLEESPRTKGGPRRAVLRGALAAACAACLLSAAVSLGGCKRMEPVEIAGEQQAWDYLGAELSKKYGEEFEFVETFEVYQVGKIDIRAGAMSYAGLFAPRADPSKLFVAGVYARDGKAIEEPADDYHQYLFKRQAEELCASKLRGREDLAGWAVVLKVNDRHEGGYSWKGATLSQYLGDYGFFDPSDSVFLMLPKGLTREEQAGVIHGCLQDLARAGCKFEVRAAEEGRDPVGQPIYIDTQLGAARDPAVPDVPRLAEDFFAVNEEKGTDAFGDPLKYWDGNGRPDGKATDPSSSEYYPTITWNPGHGPGVSFDAPPAG